MSPARLDLGGSNRVALTRAGDLVDNKEVLGDGRKLSRNSTLSPLESVDLRIEFQALTTAARGRHVLLTEMLEVRILPGEPTPCHAGFAHTETECWAMAHRM